MNLYEVIGATSKWAKIMITIGIILIIFVLGCGIFRGMFLSYIDSYELGYQFDSRTGEITVISHTGYVVTLPFVMKVNTIDLRPMQLCISANKRTLNCKLVKFNPDGLQLFLSWHGRKDYEVSGDEDGGLRDIMKSYAFDGTGANYPFLTIMPSSQDMNMQKKPEANNEGAPAPASK